MVKNGFWNDPDLPKTDLEPKTDVVTLIQAWDHFYNTLYKNLSTESQNITNT
jgi:hypothetical protein